MLTHDDVQQILHLVDQLIASETETEVNACFEKALHVMSERGLVVEF
ncbi:hypothetical protein [Tumebacillus permanentifrigoris]|uniref:Uncharacterized protein n=1 Tax=Tumebacillus permanentifrigoris TaxID=378543 RepID=A0A316DBT9_9BACL|nr:hypothetical protein [Tumebacillus permanentifrigoris]PWK15607.1 hypothetical protein C7459_103147 [Tumebacillus permanentifrigoris]